MKRTAKIRLFIERGLWRENFSEKNSISQFGIKILKRILLTIKYYTQGKLNNRASALTYSTLLATVPFLSIIFAISRGFGFNKLVEQMIREQFSNQPEAINTVIGFVNSYLMHAHNSVFIGFGLVLLLWTISILTNVIEHAFNYIWQVKHMRSTFRMITDYAAIFLLLPIAIILISGFSLFINTFVNNLSETYLLFPIAKTALLIIPYVITSLLFTGLYLFMPNTHVKFRSAFIGGTIAGISFQLFQILYIYSQVWLSGYNAVYGSFAAIPLFMIWIQGSWNIILLGSTWSYIDQNIDNFYEGEENIKLSNRGNYFIHLLIMSTICKNFKEGKKRYSAELLSKEKKIHIRIINEALYELTSVNLLTEIRKNDKEETIYYIPARDISFLTIGHIFALLENKGDESFKKHMTKESKSLWHKYQKYRNTFFTSRLSNINITEI